MWQKVTKINFVWAVLHTLFINNIQTIDQILAMKFHHRKYVHPLKRQKETTQANVKRSQSLIYGQSLLRRYKQITNNGEHMENTIFTNVRDVPKWTREREGESRGGRSDDAKGFFNV